MFSVMTPQSCVAHGAQGSIVHPAARVPEPGAGLGSSSSLPLIPESVHGPGLQAGLVPF